MVTVQSVACRLCFNSLHLSTNAVINRLHLVCYRFDTCQYSCLNDALFCEIILFGLFKALRHYHPHPLLKNQSFFFFRNSSLLGLYFLYTGLGLYTFYTDVLTLNTHQKLINIPILCTWELFLPCVIFALHLHMVSPLVELAKTQLCGIPLVLKFAC